MIDTLGHTQQALLNLLLDHKGGLTVEELAAALGITRSAIRQHLTVLERDGLVTAAGNRPTGGRPEQLYRLADKGAELQPRHYAWLAQLLIESIRRQDGDDGLGERLATLGQTVAGELLRQAAPAADSSTRVAALARLMADLGYRARALPVEGGPPVIEAMNCVFHRLAAEHPQVCRFDLALMETYTGLPVEHQECMLRGGTACRFHFKA
jgi:predicted ArsR family transcriptional regulator